MVEKPVQTILSDSIKEISFYVLPQYIGKPEDSVFRYLHSFLPVNNPEEFKKWEGVYLYKFQPNSVLSPSSQLQVYPVLDSLGQIQGICDLELSNGEMKSIAFYPSVLEGENQTMDTLWKRLTQETRNQIPKVERKPLSQEIERYLREKRESANY